MSNILKPHYYRDKIEAGLDEVARGCLFGRVYAGAVIMPTDLDYVGDGIPIRDSKKLSAKQRERCYEYIRERAFDYSVAYKEVDVVDRMNIRNATVEAFHSAVAGLNIVPEHLLVDGDFFRDYYTGFGVGIPHTCAPKGDNTYLSIACASIMAKVDHDRYIAGMVERWPELKVYGIEKNMGYGTAVHMAGLKKYGASPWHRRSFSPVSVAECRWFRTVVGCRREPEEEATLWQAGIKEKIANGV